MKKLITGLCLCCSIMFSQDYNYKSEHTFKYKAKAAATNPYNKAAVSMAVWGVGLAIGIGIICALIKPSRD